MTKGRARMDSPQISTYLLKGAAGAGAVALLLTMVDVRLLSQALLQSRLMVGLEWLMERVLRYIGVKEPYPDAEQIGVSIGATVGTLFFYYVVFGNRHRRRRQRLQAELEEAMQKVCQLQDKLLEIEEDEKAKKGDSKPVRIWMDGAFDIMHYGHMNAFRQGRLLGTHLVVGVNSDESITECKGPPVMREDERLQAVSGCKFVDEVVTNVPYIMSAEYLNEVIEKHNIDFVVHGDDPCIVNGQDVYATAKKLGKYLSIPRTEGVSTTEIVGRMLLRSTAHHNHYYSGNPAAGGGGAGGRMSPHLASKSPSRGGRGTHQSAAGGGGGSGGIDRKGSVAAMAATGGVAGGAGGGGGEDGAAAAAGVSEVGESVVGATATAAIAASQTAAAAAAAAGSGGQGGGGVVSGTEGDGNGSASAAAGGKVASVGGAAAGAAAGGGGGGGRGRSPIPVMSSQTRSGGGVAVRSKFLTTSRMLRLFSQGVSAPPKDAKVVYIDGAWDMFHAGHVEVLQTAKKQLGGTYLIVGVHSDAVVNSQLGFNMPIMNLNERVLSVLGCSYVNDVLIDAPLQITREMIASLGLSAVVHGTVDDVDKHSFDRRPYAEAEAAGIFHVISSRSTLTVQAIMDRIARNEQYHQAKFARKKAQEDDYYMHRYKLNPADSNGVDEGAAATPAAGGAGGAGVGDTPAGGGDGAAAAEAATSAPSSVKPASALKRAGSNGSLTAAVNWADQ